MVTPECPVWLGLPVLTCLVLSRPLILGAGAILWVLGISVAKKVGRGYSAGVKRYVEGGADREWRVRLG